MGRSRTVDQDDLEDDLDDDWLEPIRPHRPRRRPEAPDIYAAHAAILGARIALDLGEPGHAREQLVLAQAAITRALAASDNRTPEGSGARGVLTHQGEGLRAF